MRADDYLDLDGRLTEEERAIRDTVRDFARAELAPEIAGRYENGTLRGLAGASAGR
jgi:glutaryl-CoA dehydrogenase